MSDEEPNETEMDVEAVTSDGLPVTITLCRSTVVIDEKRKVADGLDAVWSVHDVCYQGRHYRLTSAVSPLRTRYGRDDKLLRLECVGKGVCKADCNDWSIGAFQDVRKEFREAIERAEFKAKHPVLRVLRITFFWIVLIQLALILVCVVVAFVSTQLRVTP